MLREGEDGDFGPGLEPCKQAGHEGRGRGKAVNATHVPLLSSRPKRLVLHPEARRIEVDRLGDVFAC